MRWTDDAVLISLFRTFAGQAHSRPTVAACLMRVRRDSSITAGSVNETPSVGGTEVTGGTSAFVSPAPHADWRVLSCFGWRLTRYELLHNCDCAQISGEVKSRHMVPKRIHHHNSAGFVYFFLRPAI